MNVYRKVICVVMNEYHGVFIFVKNKNILFLVVVLPTPLFVLFPIVCLFLLSLPSCALFSPWVVSTVFVCVSVDVVFAVVVASTVSSFYRCCF